MAAEKEALAPLTVAEITEFWGERCDDFEPECTVCRMWREHDFVVQLTERHAARYAELVDFARS